MRLIATVAVVILSGVLGAAAWAGGSGPKPKGKLVRQSSPAKVVAEHLDALNKCDLDRLMAQYPRQAQIHLSDGQVVVGRKAIRALFADFVKPHEQGGLCGLTFTPERTFKVGKTLAVQFRVEGNFLAQTYRGSDAYITRHGLMYAQVTTFRGSDLEMR